MSRALLSKRTKKTQRFLSLFVELQRQPVYPMFKHYLDLRWRCFLRLSVGEWEEENILWRRESREILIILGWSFGMKFHDVELMFGNFQRSKLVFKRFKRLQSSCLHLLTVFIEVKIELKDIFFVSFCRFWWCFGETFCFFFKHSLCYKRWTKFFMTSRTWIQCFLQD